MGNIEINIKDCYQYLVQNTIENLPEDEKSNFLNTLSKIVDVSKKTGIYLELGNFSKEEVDYVLLRRSKEEYEFLQSCYGKDLIDTCNENLTAEELEKLKIIIRRITCILYLYRRKGRPQKTISTKDLSGIYLVFKNYNTEEIDYVLSTISKEEKELLQNGYGENFKDDTRKENLTELELEELKKIINKIRKHLSYFRKNGKTSKIKNQLSGLYSNFRTFTKEEIDYALSRRNKEEYELLQKCYGENFKEEIRKENLTKKELEELKIILSRIANGLYSYKRRGNSKVKIANDNLKGIYFRFRTFSEEEIDYVLSIINEKDKKLLQKFYGLEFDSPYNQKNLSSEEKKELNKVIAKLKQLLYYYRNKNNPTPKRKSLIKMFENMGYTEKDILLSIKTLSVTEQESLVRLYGINFMDYKKNEFEYVEEKLIARAIRKIEINLLGLKKELPLSIYEYEKLSQIRKCYIDLAINTLEPYEQKILKTVFSEDLLIYRVIPKFKKEVDNIIKKIYYLIIAMQITKSEEDSIKFLGYTSYYDLIESIKKLPDNYNFYLNGMINLKLGKNLTDQETNNLRKIYAEIMHNLITQKTKTKKL